jgi:polyisoprenoid-binding protein YceI
MTHAFHSKIRHVAFGFLLFVLLAGALASPRVTNAADVYRIDPDHSTITFRVKHMGIAFVYGRFNDVEGSYAFDETATENCFIEIRVKAENIDTGNEKRDSHLRGPDFFDTDKFPTIVFKSVFVKKLQESTYEVVGYLTLHGITQFVTVQAVKTGNIQIPGGELRTGFETAFMVRRSDYGMKYMLGGVGDKIELTVSVEGVRNKENDLQLHIKNSNSINFRYRHSSGFH